MPDITLINSNESFEHHTLECEHCGFPIGKLHVSSECDEGLIYYLFWCLSCEEYTPAGYELVKENDIQTKES